MKTMKNTLKYLIAVFALLLAPIAYAQQNTLTGTTLGAAVTSSATLVQVASTTGMAVTSNSGYNTQIYVDGELMTVLNINGLVLTVARGQAGTGSHSHASGAVVYAGRPAWFYSTDPKAGSCVLANVVVTPWINVTTGNQWICPSVTLQWAPGFGNPGNSALPPGVSLLVASVGGATAISGPLFHISGTNAITSFTVPVGGVGQNFAVIPDAAFTIVAGNNIAASSTAIANKTMYFVWDDTNSKYVPSY